jgi:hypothetical protein
VDVIYFDLHGLFLVFGIVRAKPHPRVRLCY